MDTIKAKNSNTNDKSKLFNDQENQTELDWEKLEVNIVII